jgi:hypothetical protein
MTSLDVVLAIATTAAPKWWAREPPAADGNIVTGLLPRLNVVYDIGGENEFHLFLTFDLSLSPILLGFDFGVFFCCRDAAFVS